MCFLSPKALLTDITRFTILIRNMAACHNSYNIIYINYIFYDPYERLSSNNDLLNNNAIQSQCFLLRGTLLLGILLRRKLVLKIPIELLDLVYCVENNIEKNSDLFKTFLSSEF